MRAPKPWKPPAVIGIDPGLSGAMAVLPMSSRMQELQAVPMPVSGDKQKGKTKRKLLHGSILRRLNLWRDQYDIRLVVIEDVHAFKGQGVVSSFTFGEVFGALQACVVATDLPYSLVTPQAWKAQILAGTKKDKEAAIQHVVRLYPSDWERLLMFDPDKPKQLDDGVADAICLAEYGRTLVLAGAAATAVGESLEL